MKLLLFFLVIFFSVCKVNSQTIHDYDSQGILFSKGNLIGIGGFSTQPPVHQLEILGVSTETLLGKNINSAIRINNYNWSSYGVRSELQFGITNSDILATIAAEYTGYQSDAGGALIFATSDYTSPFVEERMRLTHSGNLGIGFSEPTARVHIHGDGEAWPLKIEHTATTDWQISAEINIDRIKTTPFQITRTDGSLNHLLFAIRGNGIVNAKTIYAEEIEVTLNALNIVPDYVFEKNYKIMPLSEVEIFYKEYKHLPEVPSSQEILEEGMNLKEMNLILLKKIEELTIHLVALEKEIVKLKKDK